MAIGIRNFPNVTAPGAPYPDGNIIDDNGTGNGTPLNVFVHADYHQFFAKLLRDAVITASDQPDNDANGYQYAQALYKLTSNYNCISTSSNSIGLGSITFNVPKNMAFQTGVPIRITEVGLSAYMIGIVSSLYNPVSSTSIVVNVIEVSGSGTFANWTINLGLPGIGAWVLRSNIGDVTFAGGTGTTTVSGSAIKYKVLAGEKTMHVVYTFSTSTSGGTPPTNFSLLIPGGNSINVGFQSFVGCKIIDGSTKNGLVQLDQAATIFQITPDTGTLSGPDIIISGELTFEIA